MGDRICVIGIGRVGLPLSLAFSEAGFETFGLDIDKGHVDRLNKAEMPFMEKGGDELLRKHIGTRFHPTTDQSVISSCDTIVLTLGTPVDDHLNPDYSQLESVLPSIIRNLKRGHLIILRSTVAPGTTEYIKGMIENATGVSHGIGFYMAYCPERIAEGNSLEEIKDIPQIVGGVDEEASARAEEIFRRITPKCMRTDAKSAELAKIFTNMYRYINFAIANEFAVLATEHGRDIHEIVDLVNKDYRRGGLAKPGFTSGPCLYKDGFFLLNVTPFPDLISASFRINEGLPAYLVTKMAEMGPLAGKKAVVLGVAFKKDIDDSRESLSFKMMKLLKGERCQVVMHDPHVPGFDIPIDDALRDADIVILAVNHSRYMPIDSDWLRGKVSPGCIVCDIWNITGKGKMIFSLD